MLSTLTRLAPSPISDPDAEQEQRQIEQETARLNAALEHALGRKPAKEGCTRMKIKAIVYDAAEGGYWAKVPSLPGLYTQAETLEELETNLREAIDLYLSDQTAADPAVAQENGRVVEITV